MIIATKYELKVVEMLLVYCENKIPTKADLDAFLKSRGFDTYDDITSTKILKLAELKLGKLKI